MNFIIIVINNKKSIRITGVTMKLTNIKGSKEKDLPGYKPYPDSEDIFQKDIETDIDPEKLLENNSNSVSEIYKEILKKDPILVSDELDVPGSELDDDAEMTGSEDEENNYYSLGGDDHNDLDEDKPE